MTWLFDLVLAGVIAEALVLVACGRRSLVPNLAAGALLLGAARVALAGAAWGWVSALLLAGLVAHVLDLRGRWMQ